MCLILAAFPGGLGTRIHQVGFALAFIALLAL